MNKFNKNEQKRILDFNDGTKTYVKFFYVTTLVLISVVIFLFLAVNAWDLARKHDWNYGFFVFKSICYLSIPSVCIMYLANYILEKFYYDNLILKFIATVICLTILFFISYYLFSHLLYPKFVYQDCVNFKNACDTTFPSEAVFIGWLACVCYPWVVTYFQKWKNNKIWQLDTRGQILENFFKN